MPEYPLDNCPEPTFTRSEDFGRKIIFWKYLAFNGIWQCNAPKLPREAIEVITYLLKNTVTVAKAKVFP